ncbi:MAG TPA: VWA domain-containing protein [Blastocatellia bacterium]|nr:VWA domain-containing protein [Blastocatellia bacterium]
MANSLRARISILLLVFAAASLQALGQSGRVRGQTQPRNPVDRDSVRLRVEEVLLPIRVRAEYGKLTAPPRRSDLIVTEDGKRRQVNDVINTPSNVLFILDAGGERTLKDLNAHRDIALKMIDSMREGDRAAIMTYSDTVEVLSQWTADQAALRSALQIRFKPGLRARFYDGLLYAAEELLPRVGGRRSVVIVGDGIETVNTLGFEKALAALHHARAIVYAACPNEILLAAIKPTAYNAMSWYEMIDPAARKRIEGLRAYYKQLEAGEVTLKGLAEETGGASWAPATETELKALGAQIVREIGTEYVIAYSSERPSNDEAFHTVKVYTTQPGIQVQSRRGIYSDANERYASGDLKPGKIPQR